MTTNITADRPVLVTGAAGFIGAAMSHALLAKGREVIGVDSLNDYYDPKLKQYRLTALLQHEAFTFERLNLADGAGVKALFAKIDFN